LVRKNISLSAQGGKQFNTALQDALYLGHLKIAYFLIEKGTPCIVIAPEDETYDEIISNAMEIKSRGGYIIGLSPTDNEVLDFHIKIPTHGELNTILNIIPIQVFAYYLAVLRNCDPDKPRNLAKSVTVK